MMLKYRNRAETPGNNIYSLLITSFNFIYKFQTLFHPYKLSYYACDTKWSYFNFVWQLQNRFLLT